MSENNEVLIDERGSPRYLDMQAGLGYTKHIGGSKATKELLELCEVNPEKVVLNVGSGAVGMNEPIYVKTPPPAAATL
jgi:hypothetical protein